MPSHLLFSQARCHHDNIKSCHVLWCTNIWNSWCCWILAWCFHLGLQTTSRVSWQRELFFSTALRIARHREIHPYHRICCQLTWRAHSRYVQLSGNICRIIEDCQTGRVNNMLTRILHHPARPAITRIKRAAAIRIGTKEDGCVTDGMVSQPGKPLHHTSNRLWQGLAKHKTKREFTTQRHRQKHNKCLANWDVVLKELPQII